MTLKEALLKAKQEIEVSNKLLDEISQEIRDIEDTFCQLPEDPTWVFCFSIDEIQASLFMSCKRLKCRIHTLNKPLIEHKSFVRLEARKHFINFVKEYSNHIQKKITKETHHD